LEDVSKLFAYELQLLFVEDVDVLVNLIFEPRMGKHVLCSSSLLGSLLQHALHEVNGTLRSGILVLDLLIKLLNCIEIPQLIGFEWDVTVEHGKQADAGTPDVDWIALVPHVLHYFGSYVSRRSALLEEQLVLFDFATDAEVTDLDVAVPIEEDVVQLDVTVGHLVLVQVCNAFHDLLEYELGILLSELSSLTDVV
jgi:hypothetical protein